MITSPNNDIERMSEFLDTEVSSNTALVMERERCPRNLDLKERNRKLSIIKIFLVIKNYKVSRIKFILTKLKKKRIN